MNLIFEKYYFIKYKHHLFLKYFSYIADDDIEIREIVIAKIKFLVTFIPKIVKIF